MPLKYSIVIAIKGDNKKSLEAFPVKYVIVAVAYYFPL